MIGADSRIPAMLGLVMATLTLAEPGSAASYMTHNFALAGIGGEGPAGISVYSPPSPTPISTSETNGYEASGVNVSAVTSTTALTGAVKSSAFATATSSGAVCCTFAGGSARAYGWAEYQDMMILSAPGIAAGTSGKISANALITGATSAQLSGGSIGLSWRTSVFVNGQYAYASYFAVGSGGNLVVLDEGEYGSQPLTFDVLFGVPMAVALRVETGVEPTVGLATPGFATGASDLGSTLAWTGINGVSVGGVALTDFSAVSPTSGFDFRKGFGATPDEPVAAVPEPGTWAMLIIGFGLIGSAARRSAHRGRVA